MHTYVCKHNDRRLWQDEWNGGSRFRLANWKRGVIMHGRTAPYKVVPLQSANWQCLVPIGAFTSSKSDPTESWQLILQLWDCYYSVAETVVLNVRVACFVLLLKCSLEHLDFEILNLNGRKVECRFDVVCSQHPSIHPSIHSFNPIINK